uniref:Uncharacterized protein n=1 Tax=Clytia hemisphaerica TaxID=252671 RepID=A0A7M5X4T9_9CNID
ILDAIRINFRSRKDNKRKLENNPNYRADSSKNSRKDTKLNNRLKALKHLNVDDETRSAISGILVRPLMSSDDEEIDGNKKTFIVRKPCWRTEGVTNCFHTLDEARQSNLSKHSLFRLMDRKDGPPSDREEPKWSEEMVKAIKFFD